MIKKFKDFNEKVENDGRITDNPNEYVKKDINKFIDQDIEVEEENTSKPAGKAIYNKKNLPATIKPTLNKNEQPNL